MKTEKNEKRVLDTFVNCCIDNIIKHELIEGVIDLKTFANFALSLELEDDYPVEGIIQGAVITYKELSNEEKKILEDFSRNSLYDKNYPMGGVTRRAYEYKQWFEHLLTIVHNQIRTRLKDNH